jgi:hypothetical protein
VSLTRFIALPDVKAKLASLRRGLPREFAAPLRCPPRSPRYSLVGTAFDYLLRFELQRRVPRAVAEPWVAEYTPVLLSQQTDMGGASAALPLQKVAERARRIVAEARAAVAAYQQSSAPKDSDKAALAAHALRLAKLDSVYRNGTLPPRFDHVSPVDVQDLLALLAVVPFDALIRPGLLLLNPTFGAASDLVGGADADLIAGGLLVDVKVTKKREIQGGHLDQLLGYLLLARRQRRLDGTFPELRRLGLYFARHADLWSQEAAAWTEQPHFAELEEWFFRRAQEVFRPSQLLGPTEGSERRAALPDGASRLHRTKALASGHVVGEDRGHSSPAPSV